MKGKIAILIGAALFLVVAAGCSASAGGAYNTPNLTCDAECEARRQADREYYAENYPTREDSLRVRECATAKTGYDEFPDLPADSGPPSLTPGTPKPVQRIEEVCPSGWSRGRWSQLDRGNRSGRGYIRPLTNASSSSVLKPSTTHHGSKRSFALATVDRKRKQVDALPGDSESDTLPRVPGLAEG